jgi:transposase
MKIDLTQATWESLEKQHRQERDKNVADRIKAVLLAAEGWTQTQIAQALRIDRNTIHQYLKDYVTQGKLKHGNGGSEQKLNAEQAKALIAHLEAHTYVKAIDICQYVKDTFGVEYGLSGMTKWLTAHKFSYKYLKGTPAKADPEKQVEFIAYYEALKKNTPVNEPIEFADGVHPTMATKITAGWIRTGVDKTIETTASRTRINIFGSINLSNMGLTITHDLTINSETVVKHFQKLKDKYPDAPHIHLILDNGPYNTSEEVKLAAQRLGIKLHYLPTYSPNLNAIEQLWKVMNEEVRNNRFFSSAKEFRMSILDFLEKTWPLIAPQKVDRVNDYFRVVRK